MIEIETHYHAHKKTAMGFVMGLLVAFPLIGFINDANRTPRVTNPAVAQSGAVEQAPTRTQQELGHVRSTIKGLYNHAAQAPIGKIVERIGESTAPVPPSQTSPSEVAPQTDTKEHYLQNYYAKEPQVDTNSAKTSNNASNWTHIFRDIEQTWQSIRSPISVMDSHLNGETESTSPGQAEAPLEQPKMIRPFH
jgi:hypothetical protein